MNEVTINLASRWKRFQGAFIDAIISNLIIVPIMIVTGVFQRIYRGDRMTISEQAIFFVVGFIVFLILNGYLLFKRGQTIGKVLVKTKIVDLNGNLPNFGKILLLRYFIIRLVCIAPFIGRTISLIGALLIFGKGHRCLHDYIAGTQVVDK